MRVLRAVALVAAQIPHLQMLQGLDPLVILEIKQTGWRGRRIHAA
jgi:hypothetical protein